MSILALEKVGYTYDGVSPVLKDIDYTFEKGKLYAIVGPSGAGKTTLLSLLSGLKTASEGEVLFNGKNIQKINRYDYRSQDMGVVFQQFNLLPYLNSLENVVLSMYASGKKIENKNERALQLLDKVALDESLAKRRILKLSKGEQQRVAIARALSFDPEIILADEPTGNLDVATQDEIMDIFLDFAHNENKCVILVSHTPEVAKMADVVYRLEPLKKRKRKI